LGVVILIPRFTVLNVFSKCFDMETDDQKEYSERQYDFFNIYSCSVVLTLWALSSHRLKT
jgi:hypothetical protein